MKSSILKITASLMAVFAISLSSCDEKKEDPAQREARREARRAEQKEEIKKELQKEAAAAKTAAETQQKAEAKRKAEAELQKITAEQNKIEADLPRVQRAVERANSTMERDRLDAQIANKEASGVFAGSAKKEKAALQQRKLANSTYEATQARNNLNSLYVKLDSLKKQETVAKKKLSDASK